MSYIEILQAKHGDSFIIHCNKDGNEGIIIVDCGPSSSYINIKQRLKTISIIDLLILTHYDDDHIGGLIKYVNRNYKNESFPVKEMWVNNAVTYKVASSLDLNYGQAGELRNLLSEIKERTGLPQWELYVMEGYKVSFPFVDIEVISPTQEIQQLNFRELNEEVGANLSATKRIKEDFSLSFEELALRPKSEPNLKSTSQLINACSIAFILKCDGLSLLMLGDSFPQTVERYLREKKGISEINKLHVDYVKVSHHGSRNNISNELLDIIDCNNFIFSTNGGIANTNHPDRETIANILCHPQRNRNKKIYLYFNYPLNDIIESGAQFLNTEKDNQEKYNFEIHESIQLLPNICQ